MAGYGALSNVYEWLIGDDRLTPAKAAAVYYSGVVGSVPPNARVLDCACGTGQLAVGLASLGLDVVAADASDGMVRRTEKAADEQGVSLRVLRASWDELPGHLEDSTFDLVFCVGNSLGHAEGAAGRLTALEAMSRLLNPGGRLVLHSRNWELVRSAGSRVDVRDRLVRRDDRDAVVSYYWQIEQCWEQETSLRSWSPRSSRMGQCELARSGCPSGPTGTRNSWRSCGASGSRCNPPPSTPRAMDTWWSPAATRRKARLSRHPDPLCVVVVADLPARDRVQRVLREVFSA